MNRDSNVMRISLTPKNKENTYTTMFLILLTVHFVVHFRPCSSNLINKSMILTYTNKSNYTNILFLIF